MRARMTIVVGAALLLALAPGAVAQAQQGADASGWSAVVLPQTEAIAALATGVAVGPDVIVAVGQRACQWRNRKTADIGRCWGQPWISPDGITWEAVEARTSGLSLGRFTMATSGPELGVEGVAYGPGGFVAYGWAKPVDGAARDESIAPTLWRSDDGRAWDRIPTPESFAGDYLMELGPWLNDIAGTEAGYLLVGTIFGTPAPRGAVWSSPDGLSWTLADGDETFDVGAYIDTMEVPASGGIAAVAVPPGATDFSDAMAVGAACPADEPGAGPKGGDWRETYDWTTGSCWARYWQTRDGLIWAASVFEVIDAAPLPEGSYGAGSVAADGNRVVAGIHPSLVLFSEDRQAWGVAGGDELGTQAALAATVGTFHALVPACDGAGCRRKTLALWSSTDGAAWAPTSAQPTMPSGAGDFIHVDAVPSGDRLVVTAGYRTTPRDRLASMALLSPEMTAPMPPDGEASADTSATPTVASTASVITLPPADAAPLPTSVAPAAGTEIAWVEGAATPPAPPGDRG